MGCDIHFYVEKYDRTMGRWEYVPGGTPVPCTGCDGTGKGDRYCAGCSQALEAHTGEQKFCHTALSTWVEAFEPCYDCRTTAVGPGREEPYDSRFYSGRNYDLFSILANVRGASPEPEWTQERDLPDDLSDGVQRAADGWAGDAHSHTWYTLDELQQVDWLNLGQRQFDKTVRRMASLGPSAEDIRAVMWFDN